jgi:hypothetical protein
MTINQISTYFEQPQTLAQCSAVFQGKNSFLLQTRIPATLHPETEFDTAYQQYEADYTSILVVRTARLGPSSWAGVEEVPVSLVWCRLSINRETRVTEMLDIILNIDTCQT